MAFIVKVLKISVATIQSWPLENDVEAKIRYHTTQVWRLTSNYSNYTHLNNTLQQLI